MAAFYWKYPEQGDHRQYMQKSPTDAVSSTSKFSTFDQQRMDLAGSNMDLWDNHTNFLNNLVPQSSVKITPSMAQQREMPSTSKQVTAQKEVNVPIQKAWDEIESRANANASAMTSSAPSMSSGSSPTLGALDIGKLVQEGARNGVNALGAMTNQQIEKDFAKNSLQAGIHAGAQASIIRDQASARNQTEQAFGMAGAMFGPVGAALGTFVGNKLGNVGAELPYMKTANSGSGKVNPQDTGIASTLNTYGQTGQTQQQDLSQ